MSTMMSDLLSEWAGVLIVMGAALLVTLAAMAWILVFRRNARRRHRRRHRHGEHHQPNPTLAQIGGLPPVRAEGKSASASTETLVSQP